MQLKGYHFVTVLYFFYTANIQNVTACTTQAQ
jgi:hypothetical protein